MGFKSWASRSELIIPSAYLNTEVKFSSDTNPLPLASTTNTGGKSSRKMIRWLRCRSFHSTSRCMVIVWVRWHWHMATCGRSCHVPHGHCQRARPSVKMSSLILLIIRWSAFGNVLLPPRGYSLPLFLPSYWKSGKHRHSFTTDSLSFIRWLIPQRLNSSLHNHGWKIEGKTDRSGAVGTASILAGNPRLTEW